MEIVDRRVPLSRIGKTVGPAPVDRFMENIRQHGIVVPVLLREVVSDDGELQFAIVDGNRRVAAARRLGHADVPARIIEGITADDAARLTLIGNNFRSANDITEFWAIKHLERSGVARQRIAEDAGVSLYNLRLRDRWSSLDRRIFVGFAEGKIPASVATKIARMEPGDQRAMGDIFASRGRVLTQDVDEMVKRRKAVKRNSPNDRPTTPARGAAPEETEWDTDARIHAGTQHDEHLERPVTIVTGAVEPGVSMQTGSQEGERLPEDVQRAVESLARVGLAREIPLADLVQALTLAYRQVESSTNVTKEAVRG